MNNRHAKWPIVLAVLLVALIVLQIMTMIQSDRMYEQINRIIAQRSALPAGPSSAPTRPTRGANPLSSPATETTGDAGDWLVWRLSMEPSTLNEIHASADMATRWICTGEAGSNIFETLLQYNKDTLELEPFIAERYDVSEDGLQITFTLRDDVHFSDGTPLTVDDVIFTYETIVNPEIDAAVLAGFLRDVDRAIRLDDRRVRFILKRRYYFALTTLGGLPILPRHIYAFDDPQQFNKRVSDPVGSGPYVFDHWTVGHEIVLRRNENYWGPRPRLERIVYRFITNDVAAIQTLREGKIDYMRPLPDQFTELSADPEFTKSIRCLSYWHPGAGFFWIGWNQDRPFFADRRVRLAMTHLVDRETICRKILNSPDAQIATGPFYIHGPQNNPAITPWPYDPKRAAELLDQAGWIDTDGDGVRDKDGVPFRFRYMIVSGTYMHEQIAKLVKDQAARVGIQVDIDPYEWSIFAQRVQDRQFDAVNMAWGGSIESDPFQLWHSSQIGNRGSNYCGFNVPEADRIIEQARQTLDAAKRNALYHRLHEILHDEQPYTFIYTRPAQRFLDRRFHGVVIHKIGVDEREWFVPLALQKY